MTKIIEFTTERLCLRQWRAADRAPFAALNADPKVMEFYPKTLHLDRAASDDLADHLQALIQARGWGFWAVAIKGRQEFIGFVGLHIPTHTLPFTPCVEIGWRLAHRHWHKGYATEAARGALGVAFESLGLAEIVSYTSVLNLRSQAVMERLGMRREPGIFDHPGVPEGSPLRAHCWYRLTHGQWAQGAGS